MKEISASEILLELDESARTFCGFPMFHNAHVLYGQSLLRAFAGSDRWLIVFDVFGFGVDICEFDYSIYYTSNIPNLSRGTVAIPEHVIVNDGTFECSDLDGNFECDLLDFVADINGKRTRIKAAPSDYVDAGIDQDTAMSTGGKILRLLVHRHGRDLFVSQEVALRTMGIEASMFTMSFETYEWRHPNQWYAAPQLKIELPSETNFFRGLAAQLAGRVIDKRALPSDSNTHWKNWCASE